MTNTVAKRENITTKSGKTLDVIKVRFNAIPEGFKTFKELNDFMHGKGFAYYDATYDIVNGKKVYKTAGYFGIKYDAKVWNWVKKTFEIKDANEGFKKAKASAPAKLAAATPEVKTSKKDEYLDKLSKLTEDQLAKLVAMSAFLG